MKLRIKTIIFLPDVIGGVAVVIHNYLKEADSENIDFIVVKIEDIDNSRPKINFQFPNAETINFKYSHFDNKVSVIKRLSDLIPNKETVIIATDSLELEMSDYLNLHNKLIFMIMGDFDHYYNLAVIHRQIIDRYLTISNEIREKIRNILTDTDSVEIKMFRFPVPEILSKNHISDTSPLRIIFVGRLETVKGIKILPTVDSLLKKENIQINWTIIGDGILKPKIENYAKKNNNVILKGFLSYTELLEEYKNQDVFFLPSKSEGLPVSLIEAMKTGLVPIISNISGGIKEIIISEENGFLINPENIRNIVSIIKQLAQNKNNLVMLRNRAVDTSEKIFNSEKNARLLFSEVKILYTEKKRTVNSKNSPSEYLSTLDKECIPDFFVKFMRKIIFYFKNLR